VLKRRRKVIAVGVILLKSVGLTRKSLAGISLVKDEATGGLSGISFTK
jgi:hypothetical protein